MTFCIGIILIFKYIKKKVYHSGGGDNGGG